MTQTIPEAPLRAYAPRVGPATPKVEPAPPAYGDEFTIAPDLPALYRLTGDLHPVHIDPQVAREYGFDRPILHGLCTLGIAARMVAGWVQAPPWELTGLQARFAAPVQPGDQMEISVDLKEASETSATLAASVRVDGKVVTAIRQVRMALA